MAESLCWQRLWISVIRSVQFIVQDNGGGFRALHHLHWPAIDESGQFITGVLCLGDIEEEVIVDCSDKMYSFHDYHLVKWATGEGVKTL